MRANTQLGGQLVVQMPKESRHLPVSKFFVKAGWFEIQTQSDVRGVGHKYYYHRIPLVILGVSILVKNHFFIFGQLGGSIRAQFGRTRLCETKGLRLPDFVVSGGSSECTRAQKLTTKGAR